MRKCINISCLEIFQDVNDIGETLKIYTGDVDQNNYAHLMSPWEKIDRLTYLQKIYSDTPYYGRGLRSFNAAPWWYRALFTVRTDSEVDYILQFDMVDYFCKVWINGEFCGSHQGYQEKATFDVTPFVKDGENHIYVKVSSPWDTNLLKGYEDMRFFSVERSMLKGTYEHADGFIQRDVNPIGIVGNVILETRTGGWIDSVRAEVAGNKVILNVDIGGSSENMSVDIQILNPDYTVCGRETADVCVKGRYVLTVDEPRYWETWDHGKPNLYTASVVLKRGDNETEDIKSVKFGFSEFELRRTAQETLLYLNNRKIFIRGTIYFPDVYFADLPKERLRRDIMLAKNAGFNAIRVHVHIERECFYDICDELGMIVFQDTDYSWSHPTDKKWVEESLKIFDSVVKRLKGHPSLGCFILLNEPDKWKTSVVNKNGCSLSEIIRREDSITKAIGEPLTELIKRLAPKLPYIRASYNEDDPESGDSHNYLGSLRGEDTEYVQIRGTTEKLNTEFGIDVPGSASNLANEPAIFNALKPIINKIDSLQYYQYKLLKYYIEHYRRQKYSPCGGYFQFMFIDLCPQSFYGVLDYWGTPKQGMDALLESNQPVAVMAVKSETGNGKSIELVIVNDTDSLYNGIVRWSFIENGVATDSGFMDAVVSPDSVNVIGNIEKIPVITLHTELYITFKNGNGDVIAKNKYIAPFIECKHIEGHPSQINSELGVRLYRK